MRILFVDNHPEFTATVVSSFLAAHDVVIVPTLALAKQRLAAASFDVVLADYDLDDGKGDELVRWMRATAASVPVVAVSAREVGNDALLAAGANAVCPKLGFSRIQSVLDALES